MPTSVVPEHINEAARKADEMILAAQNGQQFSIDKGVPLPGAPQPVQDATPPAVADPPDLPPTPPIAAEKPVDWEHKYNVLQGMFNAEVPRLQAELSSVRELVTLLSKQQQAPAAPAAPESDPYHIPQEVLKAYEDDFLDVVRKLAAQTASQIVNQQLQQLNPKLEHLGRGTAKTKEDLFFDRLEVLSPNFGRLNNDPGFLNFLAGVDPLSGIQHKQNFDYYVKQQDASAVARYFNAYEAIAKPQQGAPGTKKGNAGELEKLISPSVTGGGAGASPGLEKRTYRASEIPKIYEDAAKGKISPQEFSRLEADIFAAQREGRIIP